MPHTRGAKKALRQNHARRLKNRATKKSIKNQKKAYLEAIEQEDFEGAQEEFAIFCKKLDKACMKGPIHRNKAARMKSRLAKKLNAAKAEAEGKPASED